jgi:hypothetical protein
MGLHQNLSEGIFPRGVLEFVLAILNKYETNPLPGKML